MLIGMPSIKEHYVGDEAIAKSGLVNIKYPIQHGIVAHFQNVEMLKYGIIHCIII